MNAYQRYEIEAIARRGVARDGRGVVLIMSGAAIYLPLAYYVRIPLPDNFTPILERLAVYDMATTYFLVVEDAAPKECRYQPPTLTA